MIVVDYTEFSGGTIMLLAMLYKVSDPSLLVVSRPASVTARKVYGAGVCCCGSNAGLVVAGAVVVVCEVCATISLVYGLEDGRRWIAVLM